MIGSKQTNYVLLQVKQIIIFIEKKKFSISD